MSSPALTYPSSGEFNVLVQRFKLLNLVQRVAHRDVSEMLDTVGLDGLTRKGMLSRWAWSGPATGDGDDGVERKATRRVSPPGMRYGRPLSGTDARLAEARWSSGVVEGNSAAHSTWRSPTSTQQNTTKNIGRAAPSTTTRRRYVAQPKHRALQRSHSERESFFSRLAQPRQRPDQLEEEVPLYDDESVLPGHGGRGVEGARPWRETGDLHASELAGPGGGNDHDAAVYGGRRCGAFTSAAPSGVQRRPSLEAYAYHKHLRASSPHWAAAGSSGARRGEEFVGARDDDEATLRCFTGQLHPQRGVPADGDPPNSAFTSQPLRSVDSTPLADEGVAAAAPTEGRQHASHPLADASVTVSLPTPIQMMADADFVTSPMTGDHSPPFAATAPAEVLVRGGVSTPAVPQLHLPPPSSRGADADEFEGTGQGSGRAGQQIARTRNRSASCGTGISLSASTSQLPKSPRVGRGLAPKAKPKGAVEGPRVPLEAVRHAAALLSRSGSILPSPTNGSGAGSAHTSYTSRSPLQQPPRPSSARTPPTASGFDSGALRSPRPHTVTVKAGLAAGARRSSGAGTKSGVTPLSGLHAAASPLGPLSCFDIAAYTTTPTGEWVSPTTKKSFEELFSAIDHMLLDHQKMLRQVYKDTPIPSGRAAKQTGGLAAASQPSRKAFRVPVTDPADSPGSSLDLSWQGRGDETSQAERYADGAAATIEVDVGSDSGTGEEPPPLHSLRGEADDEMLLYTQLQHQLTELDADMIRLGLENVSEEAAEGSDSATGDGADRGSTLARGTPMLHSSSLNAASVRQPARRQRARGEVPEAIVQRLCTYRMNNFQYIAYNERLWNSSSTSQFVFAQRLTAALMEECWGEVMAEIGTIMDDYVDGLADHELQ
ncbi:hypothetical protein LSCM4_06428 [Leishmania orientalis]|uniref:Uncharacterized protein n=1 Tax=Leishmania orientalis TaxID=2249476 RepID=A0A836KS97_9TRYP|nr:hypothetical protein LSCM4_06428 [Leishmania orientalis]